ncbi:MAG: RNA methyltransferase [Desulfobacterales bacterium]|nr:RNA methyltransferase [Desulfobacteraceae bacterium]MDD3991030.1 RNA methyltransferase [Desulfobacteraceae bacterium]MDY0311844.1 RNA methyltransferase [Desulfobacterales bacterium]
MSPLNIYLALVHFPVVNRDGETIASAVTNLDLHDLARIGCTYGVRQCYIATPLADQQILVRRIVAHWTRGFGGTRNPDRRQAMESLRVVATLEEAVAAVTAQEGCRPRLVATSARPDPRRLKVPELREAAADGTPCLLIFGTASGLADALLDGVDAVLEPIRGAGAYNHLPVRAAAAIILDRLAGAPAD